MYFPGLPQLPNIQQSPFTTKVIPVLSVNYDFIPMSLESPKMIWVDLLKPAPFDIAVNQPCRLWMSVNGPAYFFSISDIIGSRIVLAPYNPNMGLQGCKDLRTCFKGTLLPTIHNSCGWGYDMTQVNRGAWMHNEKYGYGSPVSFLEYMPVVI